MIINGNKKIFEIKEEFRASFPFLKIEFFKKKQKNRSNFSNKRIKEELLSLDELKTVATSAEFQISQAMNITTLEKLFEDNFGISIQVLRKSGKIWMDTKFTETLSFEEQNRLGSK